MRVTQAMSFRFMQTEINDINKRLSDLQKDTASGKRVREVSDDPGAVRPILNFRSQITATEQFEKTISRAEAHLKNTDAVLDKIGNELVKAKEHGIYFENGSLNDDDKITLANQVGQLKEEILGLANTKVGNDYLFSGYEVQSNPFQKQDDIITYQGDANEKQVEVAPGEQLPVTVTGEKLFMGRSDIDGDGWLNASGPDMFQVLRNIELAMQGSEGQVVDVSGQKWSEYDADADPIMINDFNGNDVTGDQVKLTHAGEPIFLRKLRDEEGNVVRIGDLSDSQQETYNFNNNTIDPSNDDKPVYVHANGDIAAMNDSGDPVEENSGNHKKLLYPDGQPYRLTKVPDIEESLSQLDELINRVSNERGRVGTTLNRLESSLEIRQEANTDFKELLSTYEDTDIVEASTKMIQQETSLKAALSVTSRISRVSILDYM